MEYIYDILLNFKNNYIEFFDWNIDDNIIHVRRIPIIKVDFNTLYCLRNNKIKLDDKLVEQLENKTEVYTKYGIKILKCACLFTDGNKVIAINKLKSTIKKSALLLDEEYDVIYDSKDLELNKVVIKTLKQEEYNELKTRKEKEIDSFIEKEINKIKNNYDKLKYLYLELFDKKEDDYSKIYFALLNKLDYVNKAKLVEILKLKNV